MNKPRKCTLFGHKFFARGFNTFGSNQGLLQWGTCQRCGAKNPNWPPSKLP